MKNAFISQMDKLKEFRFHIRQRIKVKNQLDLPSSEEMKCTLTSLSDLEVLCWIDYFSKNNIGQCHFSTSPSPQMHFENITNNFPLGLNQYVLSVKLLDQRPFEHEFFFRISQSFPFLRELTVSNLEAQIEKFDDDGEHFPMIKYPHLIVLHLINIHDDYVEQFLFHRRTTLSNLLHLTIDYEQISRVTHHFTREATRINCGKVKRLSSDAGFHLSEYFCAYFPSVK